MIIGQLLATEACVILGRSVLLAGVLAMLGSTSAHARVAAAQPGDSSVVAEPRIRLELNVPAFRLDVFLSGRLLWSYTVAVGAPRYPTPVREYRITEVVWNPAWIPPPGEWARNERPQPPGPTNPMGRVKLLASQYYYLHGTPDEASLGSAASHGCIRMANRDAIELARLVHLYASPGLASGALDALEANATRTRTIVLTHPVPFSSVYRIAEVRRGSLELHPDVYGRFGDRRQEVLRRLEAAGIDPARIDLPRLESLLQTSRRERVVVPLDSLLLGRPRPGPRGMTTGSSSLPPRLFNSPDAPFARAHQC